MWNNFKHADNTLAGDAKTSTRNIWILASVVTAFLNSEREIGSKNFRAEKKFFTFDSKS